MDVLHARCSGLDIHQKLIVACVRLAEPGQSVRAETRRFGTMLADLEALKSWLQEQGVTHVAMESTGVYWKPVYNVLEGPFTLLLVNAQHVKALPGRKTDQQDAAWLAQLLQHGLLRGSFVPDRAQRELRELTRYRTALVRERATAVNRLAKTLEGANVKLGAVASNIVGVSGRAILDELVAGTTGAAALADLARGQLRTKRPALERALAGRFGAHQRFLVAEQLAHLDELDERVARLDAAVAERLRPFDPTITRLDAIPGVGRRTAEILLAELGTDMTQFPSARHCASWAGLCPGQRESAGQQASGKTRRGDPWLRSALVEAARAASRSKGTYLGAQYRRLAARRGGNKAALAVAHSILGIAYHLLREDTEFRDLGATYFDQRDRTAVERRLIRRLEGLGNTVTITPIGPAA
jgi:transposase